MPALVEPDLVGKRQDLQDRVYLADRKVTPGISSIKKGNAISNMLYDFVVKSLGARKPGGVPDGKDVSAFDAQSPKRQLQARGEVFRRAPMVGFIAQEMSQQGGVAGTPNAMTEARADQMIELKRDVEKEVWSNQDSAPDDGVRGSKMRGLGRGSIATMTQAQFDALIQAKYENTGASSDLRGFVTPVIKNRIGFFSRYQPDVTTYTSRVFVTTGFVEGNTLFGASIDVYKSDWGTFELFPVLTDFMPTAYTAYFLDMDQPRLRSNGVWEADLPNLGGGPRKELKWLNSIFPGDPRAHCKIAGTA